MSWSGQKRSFACYLIGLVVSLEAIEIFLIRLIGQLAAWNLPNMLRILSDS